jgi:hypothetical protein
MARRRRTRAGGPPALGFARVDRESSVLRWYLTRHGEAVAAEFPGLLARLAQGPAAVALVFAGDRAVALVAWRPDPPPAATDPPELDTAELLADYAPAVRGLAPERLAGFVYGPDGPLAAAGVGMVWTLAEAKRQIAGLRQAGYVIDRQAQLARPALVRLNRPIPPAGRLTSRCRPGTCR